MVSVIQFPSKKGPILPKQTPIKIPNEKNACSADYLKSIAAKQKYSAEKASSYKEALKNLTSSKPKVICFLGSLYFIGSVLKEN